MKDKIPAMIIALVIVATIVSLIVILKDQQVVNTPSQPSYTKTNTPSSNSDRAIAVFDSFVLDDESTAFETSEPIYPTQLFLVDDSLTAFYHDENGVAQSFPIEKCKSGDERIVFGDYELVIYKDTNDYISFGAETPTRNIPKEDAEQLFSCYYCTNENEEEYKAYRTNLDNNENTKEISICLFDNQDDNLSLKRFFITKDQNKPYKAPAYLGKCIKDNVYYDNSKSPYYSINEISKENIPFSYFVFDKEDENGFIQVYALLDGSNIDNNKDIVNMELTLNNDYEITSYPIDGKYNENVSGEQISGEYISGDNLIKYCFTRGVGEQKINKDTKFKIVKVLDMYGNAVIEVPELGRVLLGNN
ncbi:MAG: hypothetical protein IKI57_01885 [Clostridia bacterium]|nr:hypothetical protein [Clostridia bacterium]